jgi:hypothetical protein
LLLFRFCVSSNVSNLGCFSKIAMQMPYFIYTIQ